jgi:hypothetical protein
MNAINKIADSERYARCIQTSKRVRWDMEEDVIRGRRFDIAHKFLPDGLSLADAFTTLSADEKRFVSQIQGAPTPISLAWSSVSSTPRSSNSVTITGSATRLRLRRWFDSATKS